MKKSVAEFIDKNGHCPRCEKEWPSFSDPEHPHLENRRMFPGTKFCPDCGQKLKERKKST